LLFHWQLISVIYGKKHNITVKVITIFIKIFRVSSFFQFSCGIAKWDIYELMRRILRKNFQMNTGDKGLMVTLRL